MKITFVRPNMEPGRSADAMPPLAFAALRAHTPPGIQVEFFDECIEELPERPDTNLVALSVHTFAARRAYGLADRYRRQGIPVVLGGYHPTFRPEEALQRADAVVAGHAEGPWEKVLQDAARGTLGGIYRAEGPPDACTLRYDMHVFHGKKYHPLLPVEFSRGCRYACEFCSVSAFHPHGYTTRPHQAVLDDIRRTGARRVLFVDDNIFADREEARRLFEALVPLKIRWGCQVSLDITRQPEMLALMARSGCMLFLVGFESLNPANLKQMNKGSHVSVREYESAIRKIREHGIMIYASFVFGYDADTSAIFQRTLDFALHHRFVIANFNTLNPMPGTRLYHRLHAEGRLLERTWWLQEKYKYGEVMFRPAGMTPDQLRKGCIRVRMEFSRPAGILRRALDRKANARNWQNLSLFLLANRVTRKEYKRKMKRIQSETVA
jgi:radical SAM superfamily enzyme YgiQ (UPF0313 family)